MALNAERFTKLLEATQTGKKKPIRVIAGRPTHKHNEIETHKRELTHTHTHTHTPRSTTLACRRKK